MLATFLTRVVWIPLIERSLVCGETLAPSDAILVENFDPAYPVFERAAALQTAGFAKRALVHIEHDPDDPTAEPISRGVAELMARVARLQNYRVYFLPLARERPAPARENSVLEHRRVAHGGVAVSSGASSWPMPDNRTPAR